MSVAQVQGYLDGIKSISLDNLPLISLLNAVMQSKVLQELDWLNTIDADTGSIKTWTQNGQFFGEMGNWLSINKNVANILDNDWHYSEHTLSTGALNDAVIYSPGANYYYLMHGLLIGSNGVGLIAQNYLIELEEQDVGTFYSNNWSPTVNPWWHISAFGSTDNKDLRADISGGSGSEHIFFVMPGGKAT